MKNSSYFTQSTEFDGRNEDTLSTYGLDSKIQDNIDDLLEELRDDQTAVRAAAMKRLKEIGTILSRLLINSFSFGRKSYP